MTAKQDVIAEPYTTVTNPALGVVMRIAHVTSVNIYSLSKITRRFIVVCCHAEPHRPQLIVHFDRLAAANSITACAFPKAVKFLCSALLLNRSDPN